MYIKIHRGTAQIGDIVVTPIGVDYSAYDAYMFLIQTEGKNALYTGDYRAVEGGPDTVQSLIGIAGKLDALITEGTNIDKGARIGGRAPQTDEQLAKIAAAEMLRHSGTVYYFTPCGQAIGRRNRYSDFWNFGPP